MIAIQSSAFAAQIDVGQASLPAGLARASCAPWSLFICGKYLAGGAVIVAASVPFVPSVPFYTSLANGGPLADGAAMLAPVPAGQTYPHLSRPFRRKSPAFIQLKNPQFIVEIHRKSPKQTPQNTRIFLLAVKAPPANEKAMRPAAAPSPSGKRSGL